MTSFDEQFGSDVADQFREAAQRGYALLMDAAYPPATMMRKKLRALGYPPDEVEYACSAFTRYLMCSVGGHLAPKDHDAVILFLMCIGSGTCYDPKNPLL